MRQRALVCTLLVASLAGLVAELHGQTIHAATATNGAQAATTQLATFRLPDPSGTYGIGQIGYEWIDKSRPDGYSSDPQAHRDLMVYFWYPAPRNVPGRAAPYLAGAGQMDADRDVRPRMTEEYGALWPLMVSGEVTSHAIENAPAARKPKKLPVVIFSNGLGGTSFEYASLFEELVSHGYVVVAIENTYTASAVTFPDGRVVQAHHDPEPAGLTADQRWKRMMESGTLEISRGAADIVFVLNKLEEVGKSATPHFPLAGRLDLKRVAAAGHSAGGASTARACQLDARLRACVSLDGEMPPVAAFPEYPDGKGLQQPILLLEVDQTGKRKPFSEAQFADFQKKEEAQLQLCPKGSYYVLLNAPGLYHGSFSDYWLRAANGDATKTEQALHNLRLTESFTLAFLDKYLKDEKEPLLDEPSQTPEARVKEYGR